MRTLHILRVWGGGEIARLRDYLAPRQLVALALLLAALGGGLVLAYQYPPSQYFVDVGAPDDGPYTRNFQSPQLEGTTSYRPTDIYSYVDIPGTGSLPYTLTLRLDGSNPLPNTQPLTTTIIVGGVPLYSGRLHGGWQELSFAVNPTTAPAALAARDVAIELRSETYISPDSPTVALGPKVDWVRVTPVASGFVAPTVGVIVRLLAFAALLYLLLCRLLSLFTARASKWPFIIAALVAAALVALLLVAHQALALDSAHLLITVAATYLLLIITLLLLPGGKNHDSTSSTTQTSNHKPQTSLQTSLLIAIVVLAFAVKFGGMALPQTIVKDMPWHLRFIAEVKNGGLGELMQPGVLSVTPREWDLGSNALVPKSPLFYVLMAPLAYLPGDLEVWVKLVICLIDVSGALILFYLARRLIPDGAQAGLLAAAVYLLTPLSYRVLSFGTLPTIFAQWLTLLAFAYLALHLPRLHRPLVLVGQSLLLALVLLAFPTMVLFTPIVLGVVVVGGGLFIGDKVTRRNALIFLPLSGLVGAGLAVLLYYGRYVAGFISNTLPSLGKGTAVRGELPGDKLGGWGGMLLSNLDFYGSVFPIILAIFGLILLFRQAWPPWTVGGSQSTLAKQAYQPNRQTLCWLLLGWLLIIPLFYVVNYWLDMIGKHLLYTMYPLALASGVTLARWWGGSRWGKWAVGLLLLALGATAMSLWLGRIIYGGR